MNQTIEIKALRLNDGNPRKIKDNKFQKLVKSILTFLEMLALREVVVDETMTVLGGNMRLRALLHIAQMTEREIEQQLKSFDAEQHTEYWMRWHDRPAAEVKIARGLTDEQKQEFIAKDNVAYGEWDWDMLANEWDMEDLKDWGVDVPIDWGKTDEEFDKKIKDLSDNLNVNGFKIEVELENETQQERLYNKLTEEGYQCRILTL